MDDRRAFLVYKLGVEQPTSRTDNMYVPGSRPCFHTCRVFLQPFLAIWLALATRKGTKVSSTWALCTGFHGSSMTIMWLAATRLMPSEPARVLTRKTCYIEHNVAHCTVEHMPTCS